MRAEAVCVAPERRNRNVLTVHEDSEHRRRVQCDGAAPTGIGSMLFLPAGVLSTARRLISDPCSAGLAPRMGLAVWSSLRARSRR
ncbi:hypothetical protein Cenrod_1065 [Candidatus Symbiobacter mobilis CR]|uniref:Uncharacterized protein n=1 Tax=Candidatus Symbiobacter mobilis CR TaxID=946483 RepID=U5NAD2_9BURK|nr:hypothetical protein Cenrod_1065 [Candidatus Symbiobacter mobilis CR]